MIYRSVSEITRLPRAGAYDGAGHDECPPAGSGVGPDSLQHRHVMFDLLGIDGARSVVVDLFADSSMASFGIGDALRLDLRR